jgi:hypothetical protein
MTLSISRAWDETAALARREAKLLFPIAFLLLTLPAGLLQALAPVVAPGAVPRAGLWLIAVPVLLAASLVGALAISALALGRGNVPRIALRRFAPLLGAALLVALGGAVLLTPLALIAGAVPDHAAWPMLLALPILLVCWARLMLMTPAAAAEGGGPIALIRRSWQLSRGQVWRLTGFILLALLVSLVVLIAAGAVGGILVTLIAGRPEPGSAAMLIIRLGSALLQAVISGLFTAFVARIYAQLTSGS